MPGGKLRSCTNLTHSKKKERAKFKRQRQQEEEAKKTPRIWQTFCIWKSKARQSCRRSSVGLGKRAGRKASAALWIALWWGITPPKKTDTSIGGGFFSWPRTVSWSTCQGSAEHRALWFQRFHIEHCTRSFRDFTASRCAQGRNIHDEVAVFLSGSNWDRTLWQWLSISAFIIFSFKRGSNLLWKMNITWTRTSITLWMPMMALVLLGLVLSAWSWAAMRMMRQSELHTQRCWDTKELKAKKVAWEKVLAQAHGHHCGWKFVTMWAIRRGFAKAFKNSIHQVQKSIRPLNPPSEETFTANRLCKLSVGVTSNSAAPLRKKVHALCLQCFNPSETHRQDESYRFSIGQGLQL